MSNDYYQPMHTVQCFATLKYDVIYYNLETRILETRYKVQNLTKTQICSSFICECIVIELLFKKLTLA